MTQNFAKDLVFHGSVGFAPHVVAELRLNHHDRGFDIAAFVVAGKKLIPTLWAGAVKWAKLCLCSECAKLCSSVTSAAVARIARTRHLIPCPTRVSPLVGAVPPAASLWPRRCNFTCQEKRLPESMLSILFFPCSRPDLCRTLTVSGALTLGALGRAQTAP
jgi:hypothetical protein